MLEEVYNEFLSSGKIVTFVEAILILVWTFFLFSLSNYLFNRNLAKLEKQKNSEAKRLKRTRVEFTKIIVNYLIWIVGIFYVLLLIPGFRSLSVSILAGAGILAVVIGFAAQKTLANIVAGISIAIYTPFRIGDRLKVGDEFGDVEEINLRHTIIRTWENKRLIIPNAVISEEKIFNFSIKDEKLLITLDMGISYDSDIDKARNIMLKFARKHPDIISPKIKDDHEGWVKKEPVVRMTNCGEYAINLRLYYWVESPKKAWTAKFDLIEKIKKEFDKQGIEIPFPYRTIVFKKDLENKK